MGSFIHIDSLQTFSNSTIKKWGPYTDEKVVLQIYYAKTVYSLCIAFLRDAKIWTQRQSTENKLSSWCGLKHDL